MDSRDDSALTDRFRTALRGMAATVCVVTAGDGTRSHGMTITAAASVSMAPPALLVCLNRSATVSDLARIAQGFCLNLLRTGQEDISRAFSGGVAGQERFDHGTWRTLDAWDAPYLVEAQASLFCRKVAAFPYGTHIILIGDVVDVIAGDADAPLIYHDGRYATLAPAG